jgi:hypothetical protein
MDAYVHVLPAGMREAAEKLGGCSIPPRSKRDKLHALIHCREPEVGQTPLLTGVAVVITVYSSRRLILRVKLMSIGNAKGIRLPGMGRDLSCSG